MLALLKVPGVYCIPAFKLSRLKGNSMDMVETLAATDFSAAFSDPFLAIGFSVFTVVETGRTFGEQPAASIAIPTKNSHLFPLNGGRWFRTDVIYYPVN